MKITDITIDLETLALSTNAAILQVAAVAWNRDAEDDPFFEMPWFEGNVDVRSCIKDGFDIEEGTVSWWREKSELVKESVLTPPCHTLYDVLSSLDLWFLECLNQEGSAAIKLWANGSDFDMPVLRNAFNRYKINFPFKHTSFRDARTFIATVGAYTLFDNPADREEAQYCPSRIYQQLVSFPGEVDLKHNAVYDARLTSWQVWQLMRKQ